MLKQIYYYKLIFSISIDFITLLVHLFNHDLILKVKKVFSNFIEIKVN